MLARVRGRAHLRGNAEDGWLTRVKNFTLVRNGTCMKCDTCGRARPALAGRCTRNAPQLGGLHPI